MDFDAVVKSRRSVRSFDPSKKLSFEHVAQILDAARYAPSSGNLQNWSFVVVESLEKKEFLVRACPKQEYLVDASYLIIVVSRQENIKRYFGVRGEMLYSIQNCACAIENMLLKATDLNVASCLVNAFDEAAIKRDFNIPDDIRVQAIVCLGYSDEPASPVNRYDLEVLVHFEAWGQKKESRVFPVSQKAIPKIEERFERKRKGLLSRIFKKNKI